MILAGVLEGTVAGYFQWSVLKIRFLNMKAVRWLIFTASGAATAWLLGMIPSKFLLTENTSGAANFTEPSGLQITVLAGLSGVVLGASIPEAGAPVATLITLGTISGLLAGLSVGAVTGLFLIRLSLCN